MSEQFYHLEQTNDGRVCKHIGQYLCPATQGEGANSGAQLL